MVVFILKRLARAIFLLWAITFLTFVLGTAMSWKFIWELCRSPSCEYRLYRPSSPWGPFRDDRSCEWTSLSHYWTCRDEIIDPPHELFYFYSFYSSHTPILATYLQWTRNLIIRGEFGRSTITDDPAMDIVRDRTFTTMKLWLAAAGLVVVAGALVYSLRPIKPGRVWDAMGRNLSLVVLAAPVFWLALIADSLTHIIMPGVLSRFTLTAALLGIAMFACMTVVLWQPIRDTLKQDFIKQARSKGASARRVFWKHTLPNAVLPPSRLASPIFAALIANTIVLEVTLGWNGVGYKVWQAYGTYDYPVILAAFVSVSVLYVVTMFALDVLYAFVDPRIRRPQRLSEAR